MPNCHAPIIVKYEKLRPPGNVPGYSVYLYTKRIFTDACIIPIMLQNL